MAEAPRWTIRRVMVVIAILAPLLALARFPFPFGFAVAVGLIALLVAHSIWRRHYGRVALLICSYPALPLLDMYAQWGLRAFKVPRRPWREILEGAFGISDIGAFVCLIAYLGCVSILAGRAASLAHDPPALERAAWRVILIMPFSWAALAAFALWDPFGVLAKMFH